MTLEELDINKTYTYADYLKWTFEERVELIKGKIFKMSPAPAPRHQHVLFTLMGEFAPYMKKQRKTCRAYPAPFDVRLANTAGDANDEAVTTVVQPDFCIVCNYQEKVDGRSCLGAPDLVVEILSPSTHKKDLTEKYDLYQQAGVREYWVVYPGEHAVHVHLLDNTKHTYQPPEIYTQEDIVPVAIFGDTLQIDLNEVFAF